MVLFQIMVILTAALVPGSDSETMPQGLLGVVVKRGDKTPTKNLCMVTLTDAVGSWFRSRQKIKLKAHLAWWPNVQIKHQPRTLGSGIAQ